MEEWLSWLPGLLLGIALSAGSGFRVFIPLLVSNLAARFGLVSVSDNFTGDVSFVSVLSGMFNCMVTGFANVVVNIKKVIKRKPKSTIGVMSILVDIFLLRFFPPFFPPPELSISAISFRN
jgi:hypothetical protein